MPVRSLKSKQLNFLSSEDVVQVQNAVLQVLLEIGVRVEWQPATHQEATMHAVMQSLGLLLGG